MRKNLPKLVALAVLVVGPCWGCGSASGTPVTLIPVKGKVTYKGQPLTKGLIEFEPNGYGRLASGQLQSDGTFVLTTLKPGMEWSPASIGFRSPSSTRPSAKDRALKKYASPNCSKLTAEVSPEKTEFTFDLK